MQCRSSIWGEAVGELVATSAEDPTPDERFREYLAEQGKRLTRERNIVVQEVFASGEGFSADELCVRLSQRGDGIRVSRSTIYRTISELVQAGLLRRQEPRGIEDFDFYVPI